MNRGRKSGEGRAPKRLFGCGPMGGKLPDSALKTVVLNVEDLHPGTPTANGSVGYYADAPELGWAPGEWPNVITVRTAEGPLTLTRDAWSFVQEQGRLYTRHDMRVFVFND